MERAGSAAAREISRRYPDRLANGAVVFTGSGNNGGDGWVVAGTLARSGVAVTVIEAGKATRPKSPDAVIQREAAIDAVNIADVVEGDATIVVDALLGTGFEGEPRGKIGEAIATINGLRGQGARVASLDIPSGLDATSGRHSNCVIADLTLSFGGFKRGTLLARDVCGEIVALDIGLDDAPRAAAESRPRSRAHCSLIPEIMHPTSSPPIPDEPLRPGSSGRWWIEPAMIAAARSSSNARFGCSIDPRKENLAKAKSFLEESAKQPLKAGTAARVVWTQIGFHKQVRSRCRT